MRAFAGGVQDDTKFRITATVYCCLPAHYPLVICPIYGGTMHAAAADDASSANDVF
jgi:hypothetical protein